MAGIDEAGRGALAGPVAVGVVVFGISSKKLKFDIRHLPPLRDSKQLSPKQREIWFEWLKREQARKHLFFSVGLTNARTIDQSGIVPAIRLATTRALHKLERRLVLSPQATQIFLDGGLVAPLKYSCQWAIVRGDETEPIITLASIVAKVSRDATMRLLAKQYPNYQLDKHKGYGTRDHYDQLRKHGLSVIHRRSFLSRSGL